MALHRNARVAALVVHVVAGVAATAAQAVPVTPDELVKVCAQAEGSADCGRLVEAAQLARLPNLATRDGPTLKVSLFPAGIATFADAEAQNGGRSYSLWDYMSEINAVVLYTTDGDGANFTLLQRATGRKTELPSDPKLSPDRARLVTADFCETRCVNELAVWRVTKDGVQKEWTWKPKETWIDAAASWKNDDTVAIDYTVAGTTTKAHVERRLADASWTRAAPR